MVAPEMPQKGAAMTQPLSGITVLDFTTLLPGPLATLMLAEAGAEVIKIERPGGEELRRHPPYIDGESAVYAMLNRGKKSIVLDLKAADAGARLEPLLARCDVVVEQFRPGVMARLGLGYEAVKAMNPRVVYCAITGYGQDGPRRNEAGHDFNYIAATGLLALSPGRADPPTLPPAPMGDIGGAAPPAGAQRGGRGHHGEPDRAGVGAGVCRRRWLRHHRDGPRTRCPRSAFRSPRPVRPPTRQRKGDGDAGPAGPGRPGISPGAACGGDAAAGRT